MENYLNINIYLIISCLYSLINNQVDMFNNRENKLTKNEITIIIPSVYRKD